MVKHTYYYLEDSSCYVVVTSVSRYGKINDYEHKALKKPHLFATEEEAKILLRHQNVCLITIVMLMVRSITVLCFGLLNGSL